MVRRAAFAALLSGAGLLVACSPPTSRSMTITEVSPTRVCAVDRPGGDRCAPLTDFAHLGFSDVAVGDCLKLKFAYEANQLIEATRASGCPPLPAGSDPSSPSEGTSPTEGH